MNNKNTITTFEELIEVEHGKVGSKSRNKYDAKVQLFIVSEMLKEARKDAKLTQEQLAKMIFNVGPIKFPAGKMLYSIIKFVLELIFIYIIIYVAIHYTSIIKL